MQRTALSTLTDETVPAFVAEVQGDVTKLVERCGDDLDAVSGDLPLDQVASFQSDLDGAAVASVLRRRRPRPARRLQVEAGDLDARETEACGVARMKNADALMETAAEAARDAVKNLAGACEASAAALHDAAASASRARRRRRRSATPWLFLVPSTPPRPWVRRRRRRPAARAEASVPREGAPHVARSDSVALDPTPAAAQRPDPGGGRAAAGASRAGAAAPGRRERAARRAARHGAARAAGEGHPLAAARGRAAAAFAVEHEINTRHSSKRLPKTNDASPALPLPLRFNVVPLR